MAKPGSILFYTCANRPYHDFAPLYACSVLHTVPGARVEFGVEGAFDFEAAHGGAIDVLHQHYGADSVSFRSVNWKQPDGQRILPNTTRFITPPMNACDHIYIGDIDIIFLDQQFPAVHFAFMRKTGLPYSNSVRPGTKRMSGLHFSEYAAYYPLPALDGLDIANGNDEEVLYQLCVRKGLEIQDKVWFRPTHGIHISPNRTIRGADGQPGWGVESRLPAYGAFIRSSAMTELRPYLSDRMRGFLDQIEQDYGVTLTVESA